MAQADKIIEGYGACVFCKNWNIDSNLSPCLECEWLEPGDEDNWEAKE